MDSNFLKARLPKRFETKETYINKEKILLLLDNYSDTVYVLPEELQELEIISTDGLVVFGDKELFKSI